MSGGRSLTGAFTFGDALVRRIHELDAAVDERVRRRSPVPSTPSPPPPGDDEGEALPDRPAIYPDEPDGG